MRYCFAPMEGITGKRCREAHAEFFPGVDRYCLPFLTPTDAHCLTAQQRRLLDPGSLDRARLLPQVLTKSAEDFVWFASALADLGWSELNLNLGCPSGTVVSKGRGAGLLRDLDALRRFLDEIFTRSPLPISIKTRIGLESESEFEAILALLCEYPLHALCIHPRTRREMYTGGVHLSAFARAAERAPFPLCYNGNLFTPASVQRIKEAFPGVTSVMLGRGMLADPALIVRCRGGSRSREALLGFHETLAGRYLSDMHPQTDRRTPHKLVLLAVRDHNLSIAEKITVIALKHKRIPLRAGVKRFLGSLGREHGFIQLHKIHINPGLGVSGNDQIDFCSHWRRHNVCIGYFL